MSTVERALAIQRLQIASELQRSALERHAAGLQPAFDVLDQARAGARWLGRHPEVLAGAAAFLLATSSDVRRTAWRWGGRALFVWRLWRDSKRWLQQPSR